MNNSDMPAMPHDIVFGKGYPENYDGTGLTKREQFCLTMGVADTGDVKLNAIITKGNRQNLWQGVVIRGGSEQEVEYAEYLLRQLRGDV
jgi:hypothetical protein